MYLKCISLIGLKYSKWKVNTFNMIKVWEAINCSKFRNRVQQLVNLWPETTNDPEIDGGSTAH